MLSELLLAATTVLLVVQGGQPAPPCPWQPTVCNAGRRIKDIEAEMARTQKNKVCRGRVANSAVHMRMQP